MFISLQLFSHDPHLELSQSQPDKNHLPSPKKHDGKPPADHKPSSYPPAGPKPTYAPAAAHKPAVTPREAQDKSPAPIDKTVRSSCCPFNYFHMRLISKSLSLSRTKTICHPPKNRMANRQQTISHQAIHQRVLSLRTLRQRPTSQQSLRVTLRTKTLGSTSRPYVHFAAPSIIFT
jgi:hypothetical protein